MIELLNPDNAYSGANLVLLLVLVLLSTVFFICFSGFVKYSIVLNIIKNAVGTQQIPPSMVVNLLAVLMALNSIWPDIKPGLVRVKPYFVSQVQQDVELEMSMELELPEEKRSNITMYNLVSNLFDYFPELLSRAERKTNQLNEIVVLPLNFGPEEEAFKFFIGNLILDLYQGFELGLKLYTRDH
ncbi:EscR/YscR/HrcR family type III secretion system export apparatus protein [Vibrio aestuarianus]|nr:EscR/YscR/HrcR family type III secretion system export apparatus protein [Vibrio aestuarianus]MDE1236209.1 EscR/YscR/HrcR family type III secretion system export apparatus protein [Vibrio aestuarianus]MDE1247117.1 EscR/YscR/HrcR family type III secretion system export apparatus protein [Vibrio aestuarianus]NGZ64169.1 EscR/YscR/HrcR family type III secretion system export apparatus protein [Vibrio aestuarianus subsp. cardii]